MADNEHLKILCQGVETWNEWRKRNPAVRPNLQGVDFTDSTFRNTPLWNDRSVDLTNVDLSNAILHYVNLSGAMLSHARLSGADLQHAKLSRAALPGADLSGAYLWGAELVGADLLAANLADAKLMEADLTRARLTSANLSDASLTDAKLFDAELERANLSRANLTGVRGLSLNSNWIANTRFSPNAKDYWSVLRRKYTGPSMVVNLILVLLFFGPLAAKGLGLWGMSELQAVLIASVNRTGSININVGCNDPDIGAITATLNNTEIDIPCRSMPMWKLLLGFGGPYGILMPILSSILILYQVARYLLTRQVSLIRDAEEERSSVSPSPTGPFSYPKLYRVHRVISIVYWISIATFVLRAVEFLFFTEVILGGRAG